MSANLNQSVPFMNVGIVNIYQIIEEEGIPWEVQLKLLASNIVLTVRSSLQRIEASNWKWKVKIDSQLVEEKYELMRSKLFELLKKENITEEDIYWFDDEQMELKKIYEKI